MGAKHSRLSPVDLADLRRDSHFSYQEIQTIYNDFVKTYPKQRMTRDDLCKFYKSIYQDGDPTAFVDQLMKYYDGNKDGYIDFREFLCGLGVFAKGTDDEKLRLAFQIYDADGNHVITKDEIRKLVRALHKARSNGYYDEKAADMVGSIMFKALDIDKDKKITLEEFIDGAKNDPSVMRLLEINVIKHKS